MRRYTCVNLISEIIRAYCSYLYAPFRSLSGILGSFLAYLLQLVFPGQFVGK